MKCQDDLHLEHFEGRSVIAGVYILQNKYWGGGAEKHQRYNKWEQNKEKGRKKMGIGGKMET